MAIYIYSQRIPAEYQEVEYIQSTATNPGDVSSSGQYIDTLVTINKNITVEVDMQFTSLAVQSRLFGGLYDSGSSGITFGPYINGSTQWARATANGVGNWQSTNVAANTNRNKFVLDNTRYIIYNSSGTQVYNGTNSSTISNSDTWTIPLLASKDRTQNKVNRHSSAKLYGSRIWDNGVLVRDFVPCYRKLDGEIGLYDLVDGGFYANQGTGTFTKGADVTGEMELKNAYIGSIRKPSAKTVAYFPFKDDIDDHSGNGVTISNTQYLSKQEIGYKWQFSQGATGLSIGLSFENADAKFVSIWYKVLASSGNAGVLGLDKYGSAGYAPSHGNTSLSGKFNIFTSSSWAVGGQSSGLSFNEWHNITVGYDGSKVVISKDGVETTLYNGAGYNFGNGVGIISGGNNANMQILISEFICETENWSSQKKLDYYNTTKGNYGL